MKTNAVVRVLWLFVVILHAATISPKNLLAQCTYPNYGSGIFIDGSVSDWDTAADFFSAMRRGNGDILANLYLRYDCDNHTMYALVLAADYPTRPILAEDGQEVWIEVNGGKVVTADDRPTRFRYIDETTLSVNVNSGGIVLLQVARGWEASFSIEPGQHLGFLAHNNVWDPAEYNGQDIHTGSQTAATPKMTLCIECHPIGVELQSFDAVAMEGGVLVGWSVASEINHAGYNLYRASSFDGDYFRINDTMIGIDPGSSWLEETHHEYLDTEVVPPSVYYKLEDISLDGQHEWFGPVQATITSDVPDAAVKPVQFDLAKNYPNPFNPTTTIGYSLPVDAHMQLDIYDVKGTRVQTLVNGAQSAGVYTVTWDGRNNRGERVTSGIYLYRMTAGEFAKTGRMTLLK